MAYRVTITPSQLEFFAEETENILEAALNAKLNLPHGCKSGDCGSCKSKVISGKVDRANEFSSINTTILSPEEQADNYVLLCQNVAQSDVILDLPGFVNSFPIRTLPTKIDAIDKIGSVAVLKLKLPAGQNFQFASGQYIDIIYEGKNRSYSLANAPSNSGMIELHVRYRQGGIFSEAVWDKLAVGQILRFRGPLGSFVLKNTQRPILMVCTGTGFAPLKAIMEQLIAERSPRAVTLVWGNYQVEDFYLTESLKDWQQQLDLTTILCADQAHEEGYYLGLVTDYVKANFPNLSEYELYACGNPAMIAGLYTLATNELSLSQDCFYSDVFTPSVPKDEGNA